MIIPVYKPVGASTHLLAKKAGDIHQTKATHTGTLDPMASGVVVVLTAEDRFRKSELAGGEKTYEFEILWGVATDSHDLLGLTTETSQVQVELKKLEEILPNFTGNITQQMPKFSAQRINGESYFDQAKKKTSFEPRSESIQIHSLKLKNSDTVSRPQLQKYIEERINLVTGDFRQKEILENWGQIIPQLPEKLIITKLMATTSKRAYVRALVRDISKKINIPATTYSITRTQNGKYTIKDCICLI
jgi:tRNA pseudouridine(55) synthase